LTPTLTIQASLRGIDRHQAQTLGTRWPSSPSANLLWASGQSRPSTEGGSKPSGRPSGTRTTPFGTMRHATQRAPCCAGHPRARRDSVNPSVEVGISLAASRLTGGLTFPALCQGTVTTRRGGARETR